jgi:eukaryotic-like serine/threonine-protein kinase
MIHDVLDYRYVRSDLLGGGGIAKVFLTHDQILGRDVALKVLRKEAVRRGRGVG